LSIHTIEVEGELSQAVYSIEEYCQNTPAKSTIAVARNPIPIPQDKEPIQPNIQVQTNGQQRSVTTISQSSIPHIAAMGRLSPDKEELLQKEIEDLLARGLIEFSDGTWRALQEDSKPYTGFATRSGFYQWKYLPMGFKNAGAAFQRQMDTVFRRAYQPSEASF
jgi:hypothetical protein